MQELLEQLSKYLKRELPIGDIMDSVRSVITKSLDLQQDQSTIIDILVLFDWDHDSDKQLLNQLVVELERKSLLPRESLIERLEHQMLLDCQLIDDNVFNKKLKRVYTDNYFTLQKYTLFREQTQGFSKLVVEILLSLVPPLDTFWIADKIRCIEQRISLIESKSTILLARINELIGLFMLDPTRVLDILLDLFTENVQDHW